MNSLLPSAHVMRWVLALVAVVMAWSAGSYFGAQNERRQLAATLSEQQSDMTLLEQKFQTQITELRTQRDIADAGNQSLQKSLQELQAQSLEQRSTQRLYDNIEGKDVSSGLGVDTVTRVNDEQGNPIALNITVVQARGRNRVKGRIGVVLLGEKAGKNWQTVIVDADKSSAPRFDMRFFQTIEVPISEGDVLIDIVEISVHPVGNQHKPFSVEIDWSDIL